MYTKFGEITQPFIKSIFSKNITSVSVLIMFYETRTENIKKYFIMLSCVIHATIKIMSVLIICIINKKFK